MPDLLLELLSEEIPARMQARAAEDLRRLVTDALVERGFLYEGAQAFATPRRLALHVVGLPARGRDMREERKGPRVGAPEAALAGFLKSAGVASVEGLSVQSDPKKGEFYVAVIERPGRATPDVVAEILPEIVRTFPWPKSMRWGAASAGPGSLRWVRPLQSILCTFGTDVETPEIVAFSVDGIASGDTTRGHRFLAPGPIRARRFDDYVAALEDAKVILDPARRRDVIRHDSRDLAFAQGLEVVEDEALLEEVAGLVEWPVVLMGTFDPAFLAVPAEAIRATIRANQKCFVLRDPAADDGRGALANRFLLTANIEATDGGTAIVAGNERVVRARLADARFFWEQDLKAPLESRLDKLGTIVFHEKLGTQGERVERIAALARELAPAVGADPDLAERAARLAKADLTTEMVGEFPELQGLMGRTYATAQGEDAAVATAVEEHYRPLGPADRVPTEPVSVAVALADKLDTLVGFWAIDEKPTGSKDPFALRRAALGVIRIVVENGLTIQLDSVLRASFHSYLASGSKLKAIIGLHAAAGHDMGAEEAISDLRSRPIVWNFLNFQGAIDMNEYLWRTIIDNGIGSLLPIAIGREFGIRNYTISSEPNRSIYLTPLSTYADAHQLNDISDISAVIAPIIDRINLIKAAASIRVPSALLELTVREFPDQVITTLLAFFHERLKTYLRDRGARHDLIDAVLGAGSPSPAGGGSTSRARPGTAGRGGDADGGSSGGDPIPDLRSDPPPAGEGGAANDDLLAVVRRVEALGAFLDTEDGANLLAGVKRASNILRIEEKKDGRAHDGAPDPAAFVLPEERALAEALATARAAADAALAGEDVPGALAALTRLRPAVDAFFDRVTVNDPEPRLRDNRLALLAGLRDATRRVADFGRIGG